MRCFSACPSKDTKAEKRRSYLFFVLIMFWPLVFASTPSLADVITARRLLAELSSAISSRSFSGDFTFENGTHLDTFRIVHKVDGDEISETLYRLSGAEQQFSRQRNDCGTLGSLLLRGLYLSSSDGRYIGLDRYYLAQIVGKERIAGRAAWIIELLPTDENRFGVTYAIDVETYLLLRYEVFDAQKRIPLERLQFVSLESEPKSSTLTSDQKKSVELEKARCIDKVYQNIRSASGWVATWLPPGFILSRYGFSDRDGHVETYTDGIASFSLFVKNEVAPAQGLSKPVQRATNRGATMALMTASPNNQSILTVNVVGEIPLSVAQKISRSLKKKPESSPTVDAGVAP